MVLQTRLAETINNAQTFEVFFERWLISQENYLQDLHRMIECRDDENEQRCRDLIDRIVFHYKQYFEAKTRVVQENVFLVLTPTWFSSFERAYLWIGGFRPGLAFRLVINNVLDLTEDQSQRINRLMVEIKEEEKEVTEEFNRVQEGMNDTYCGLERVMIPPIQPNAYILIELNTKSVSIDGGTDKALGTARRQGEHNMESAVDRLSVSMEALVECADLLRRKTSILLVEILKPAQAVRFFAAAAQLQLNLRRWGMQRDVQNRRHIAGPANVNGAQSPL
ncbi:hypothetical protein DH2020_022336 [Rehmannia glutinosa]|uniref:DOG1 domain-containing protein n=1 Tax=Rehmannia glutinosa TaxID=99300 RepID=A0ABR0WFY6_REHGL